MLLNNFLGFEVLGAFTYVEIRPTVSIFYAGFMRVMDSDEFRIAIPTSPPNVP